MWIQDFPDDGEGGANPKDGCANQLLWLISPENCKEIKKQLHLDGDTKTQIFYAGLVCWRPVQLRKNATRVKSIPCAD